MNIEKKGTIYFNIIKYISGVKYIFQKFATKPLFPLFTKKFKFFVRLSQKPLQKNVRFFARFCDDRTVKNGKCATGGKWRRTTFIKDGQ